MPKLKTNKSVAKRVKRTATGKYLRHKAFSRKLKTSKSSKRRRNLRKADVVSAADHGNVKRMLPYG